MQMDSQSVSEAIEILVSNFTRHPSLSSPTDSDTTALSVYDVLQRFWDLKLSGSLATLDTLASNEYDEKPKKNDQCDTDSSSVATPSAATQVLYEFLEKPSLPFVCFVTLPDSSCFATFQHATTKNEAKKSAATLALMNSVYNEHPLRQISDEFIEQSVAAASVAPLDTQPRDNSVPTTKAVGEGAAPGSIARATAGTSGLSVQLYKRMLHMCRHKSMMEFKQMMCVFQLLQWNGSLRAMRERNCHLDEVIDFYKSYRIDDSMRAQMALDWISREQLESGSIGREMCCVDDEIEEARLAGRELRFLKEKRDILLLASYQFDMVVSSGASDDL